MGPVDCPPGTVKVKALSEEIPMLVISNLLASGELPASTVYDEADSSS